MIRSLPVLLLVLSSTTSPKAQDSLFAVNFGTDITFTLAIPAFLHALLFSTSYDSNIYYEEKVYEEFIE